MTYKLFEGIDEEFNLSVRSFKNIQNVCRVMCECNFLSEPDVFHYVQIGGFTPEKQKGQEFYAFDKLWSKSNYLMALLPYLFSDAPALWTKDGLKKKVTLGDTTYTGQELQDKFLSEEAYSALGFFLSCIGETLHDHSLFLNSLTLLQQLAIKQQEITEDGEG
jgi:hypothetical protein